MTDPDLLSTAMDAFTEMPKPFGIGPIMWSLHDPLGMYLYASPETQLVLGVDPDDLLGNNAATEIMGVDLDVVADAYEHAFRTREPVRLCVPGLRDGQHIWIESTFQAIEADGTMRLVAASRETNPPATGRCWWRLATDDPEPTGPRLPGQQGSEQGPQAGL